MQLEQLKEIVKQMSIDYRYTGRPNANQYTGKSDRLDRGEDRTNSTKSRTRLSKEDKMIAINKGLLCDWFMARLNEITVDLTNLTEAEAKEQST